MLDFVPFYVHTWSDKKVKELTAEQTVLFTYLFANEALTLCGIYELDIELCEHRLKNKLNGKFAEAFQALINAELIAFDSTKHIIWIINRFKILRRMSESEKIVAGVVKELRFINHPFKDMFIEKYADLLRHQIWRLPEQEEKLEPDYFLDPTQLRELNKFYKTRSSLKSFLLHRHCNEQKIDDILAKVLPNLR